MRRMYFLIPTIELTETIVKELQERCTTVIVSHRPSYLSLADRVFTLRNGILVPGNTGAREQLERIKAEFTA